MRKTTAMCISNSSELADSHLTLHFCACYMLFSEMRSQTPSVHTFNRFSVEKATRKKHGGDEAHNVLCGHLSVGCVLFPELIIISMNTSILFIMWLQHMRSTGTWLLCLTSFKPQILFSFLWRSSNMPTSSCSSLPEKWPQHNVTLKGTND